MDDDLKVPDVVDNIFAPEFFTDGAFSFFLHNGVLRIVFGSVRSPQANEGPGVPRSVVIGRLVMPVAGAQNLAIGLYDFLEKQGLSPTSAVKGDATAQ